MIAYSGDKNEEKERGPKEQAQEAQKKINSIWRKIRNLEVKLNDPETKRLKRKKIQAQIDAQESLLDQWQARLANINKEIKDFWSGHDERKSNTGKRAAREKGSHTTGKGKNNKA